MLDKKVVYEKVKTVYFQYKMHSFKLEYVVCLLGRGRI